jgi:hypothetical protein
MLMNDYSGKVCPYCKGIFSQWDDIVVCSDCDMPHHRQCWIDNQCCTTFGCLGTIRTGDSPHSSVMAVEITFDDEPAFTAPQPGGYCPACGAPHFADAAFCSRCGRPLTNPQPTASNNSYAYTAAPTYQPQPAAQGNTIAQLVGTNQEYYLAQFDKLRRGQKMTSWNWAAFLFGAFWMLYRKMYLYGGLGLVAVFVVAMFGSPAMTVLLWGGYIVLGIFANYLYMTYLESQVEDIAQMPLPQQSAQIAKQSGVHWAAAIGAAVGYVILVILFTM